MSPEFWIHLGTTAVILLGVLWRMAVMATKFEAATRQAADDIKELKDTMKGLAQVVTTQAVTTTRLDLVAERISQLERSMNELRHGEGYIYPLQRPKPPVG